MLADKSNQSQLQLREWLQRYCVKGLLSLLNVALFLIEGCTRLKIGQGKPTRILVLRTAALGDFILSIPAMRRLRSAYPAAHITLLTTATTDRTTFRSVAQYANERSPWLNFLPHKLIDDVIVSPFLSYGNVLNKESREILCNRNYDICFILNEGIGLSLSGTVKKIAFLRLLGVFCRIYGIRTRAYPKLFPKQQIGERRLEHHVLAIMRSVEENIYVAHCASPKISFDLSIVDGDKCWAKNQLIELGCQPKNLIVIAPGSRLEFKRWRSDGYASIIASLLANPFMSIILVGSGPEVESAGKIYAACMALDGADNRLHNLSGKTSLGQLAALLSNAPVLLANDGGTCHLAAAVGCRVVSIGNGAEIPNSVEPWGNQQYTVRIDVPCAPCYCFTHCIKFHARCVNGISSALVLKQIQNALADASQSINANAQSE